MNRQVTGRIATYHFSPTLLSRQNLLNEGVKGDFIIVTGNTVIDSIYMVVDRIRHDKLLEVQLRNVLSTSGYDVKRLSNDKKLVLITGHRRENFGDGFISMCQAIKALSEKYPNVDFVYPTVKFTISDKSSYIGILYAETVCCNISTETLLMPTKN